MRYLQAQQRLLGEAARTLLRARLASALRWDAASLKGRGSYYALAQLLRLRRKPRKGAWLGLPLPLQNPGSAPGDGRERGGAGASLGPPDPFPMRTREIKLGVGKGLGRRLAGAGSADRAPLVPSCHYSVPLLLIVLLTQVLAAAFVIYWFSKCCKCARTKKASRLATSMTAITATVYAIVSVPRCNPTPSAERVVKQNCELARIMRIKCAVSLDIVVL